MYGRVSGCSNIRSKTSASSFPLAAFRHCLQLLGCPMDVVMLFSSTMWIVVSSPLHRATTVSLAISCCSIKDWLIVIYRMQSRSNTSYFLPRGLIFEHPSINLSVHGIFQVLCITEGDC